MIIDDSTLSSIFDRIVNNHGTPLFVGEFVRDKIMGLDPKNLDIEIYNLTYDELNEILREFGDTDVSDRQFGIIGVGPYEFRLPRVDQHSESNPHLSEMISIEHSCATKNFTINSMAMTVFGELLDYFGGQNDILSKTLRPTSSAFWKDMLGPLKGFNLSGKFGFSSSYKLRGTLDEDLSGSLKNMPKSFIYREFRKWALNSTYCLESLKYLIDTMNNYFPAIYSIHMLPQDPEWHPEGDVLVHTGYVLNEMATIIRRENLSDDDKFVMMMAALCHDFGKASTTEIINGRYRAYGHEKASLDPTINFLEFIGAPPEITKKISNLVVNHMAFRQPMTNRALKRLANRLAPHATIRELAYLIEADQFGRPPLPKVISENMKKALDDCRVLNILDGPFEEN